MAAALALVLRRRRWAAFASSPAAPAAARRLLRFGGLRRPAARGYFCRAGSLSVQPRTGHARPAGFGASCRLARSEAEERAVELAEIRAIASGDAAAFERLIGRETPRLLRFAQGMLGTLEEAEDVVQDTLLRLWQNAGVWKPEARIGTWLHTVCYNRAIDRLRRRRVLFDENALEALADQSELADAGLVRREAARSVGEAIGRLPHRQRTAVLLFHFQELPQRDAAHVMGISETAFESLLARARRQMRRMLSAEGERDD